MESATINNKFTYHSPNEEQVKKFQNIRYNAKNFAPMIVTKKDREDQYKEL